MFADFLRDLRDLLLETFQFSDLSGQSDRVAPARLSWGFLNSVYVANCDEQRSACFNSRRSISPLFVVKPSCCLCVLTIIAGAHTLRSIVDHLLVGIFLELLLKAFQFSDHMCQSDFTLM